MTLDPVIAPESSPASSLATQVARLFFDRGMTKVEIGAHLGISRFRVARLLDDALADGSVRIEYRDIPAQDRALATAMEERFGLDLCAVATDGEGTAARLAGTVLEGLIEAGEVIGIAWGSTLAEVVGAIPVRHDPSIEVVQLAGSSTRLDRGRDAGELSRILADRLGARHHAIFAPAFVRSRALRDELRRTPEVAEAADRFGAVSLAVIGIGAMPAGGDGAVASTAAAGPASSLVRSGVLAPAEVEALVAAGAIGDLVVHPFDRDGRFIAPDLAARAIAIDIEMLRAVPRVVAVAAGAAKVGAIRGALAGGVVRILVTDASTAQAVLA